MTQNTNKNSRSLDIGCGSTPRNIFGCSELFGVDLEIQCGLDIPVEKCNLGFDKVPFEDNFFDFVTAHDVLEHIIRVHHDEQGTKKPFIYLMNEIHRILKDGGEFFASTPAYPSGAAFGDPTHVNYITWDTAGYFSKHNRSGMAEIYGIKTFHILENEWRCGAAIGIPRQNLSRKDRAINAFRVKVLRKGTHITWHFKK
jgi:SAM-dependent methyltransferase